jgi:hypothetical protein
VARRSHSDPREAYDPVKKEMRPHMTGVTIAWIREASVKEEIRIPIPMVNPHNAQPTEGCARIIMDFLIFVASLLEMVNSL